MSTLLRNSPVVEPSTTAPAADHRIHIGHVAEVLRGLPEASVDCVFTSPPYWGLRAYGEGSAAVWGGDPACPHQWEAHASPFDPTRFQGQNAVAYAARDSANPASGKGAFCACGAWRGELGLEPDPGLYLQHLIPIFDGVERVLKPTGTLWLNIGDTHYSGSSGKRGPTSAIHGRGAETNPRRPDRREGPWLRPKQLLGLPERVMVALQERGWLLRNKVVWWKRNGKPTSAKDRFTQSRYEPIYLFAHPESRGRYYFNLDAVRVPHITLLKRRPHRTKGGDRKMDAVPGQKTDRGIGKFQGHDDPDLYHPAGANPGVIWDISAQNIAKGTWGGVDHFAVFPEELALRVILAGCPSEVCVKCGKPKMLVQKGRRGGSFNVRVRDAKEGRIGKKWGDLAAATEEEAETYDEGEYGGEETATWEEVVCGGRPCGAGFVPGVVLDPFAGAFTVAKVARDLKRRSVSVEINPKYLKIAEARLNLREQLGPGLEVVRG